MEFSTGGVLEFTLCQLAHSPILLHLTSYRCCIVYLLLPSVRNLEFSSFLLLVHRSRWQKKSGGTDFTISPESGYEVSRIRRTIAMSIGEPVNTCLYL